MDGSRLYESVLCLKRECVSQVLHLLRYSVKEELLKLEHGSCSTWCINIRQKSFRTSALLALPHSQAEYLTGNSWWRGHRHQYHYSYLKSGTNCAWFLLQTTRGFPSGEYKNLSTRESVVYYYSDCEYDPSLNKQNTF